MKSEHMVQALTVAAGLVLAALLKQRMGLRGLRGADDCETWRQIAAGYRYSEYTDTQRREASANWNSTCQTAGRSESQAAGQAAAARLRSARNPSPSDYPAYVIPAPECTDPPYGACTQCTNRVLRYNLVAIANARRAYRRARCEYDCEHNTAAGDPENCRDCSQFDALALPERPECGGALVPANRTAGDIQIPNAAWVAAEPGRFPEQGTAPAQNSTSDTDRQEKSTQAATTDQPASEDDTTPPTEPTLPKAITDAIDELPLPAAVKAQPWLLLTATVLMGVAIFK